MAMTIIRKFLATLDGTSVKRSLAGGVAMASLLLAGLAPGQASAADLKKISFALPNMGTSNAYGYVALAMGYWKDQGLDVEPEVLGGIGGSQAMLAGDVQFAVTNGVAGILMASMGQPSYAIANMHSMINFEVLMSVEAAKQTGLDPKTSSQEARAKVLKGMTIGVEGTAGSIPDSFARYVVKTVGGLDPQTDVTLAYIPNGGGDAALRSHRVSAVVSSPPYTNTYEHAGTMIDWLGNTRGDLKDLVPIVFDIIAARKDYCEKNADICRGFLKGVQQGIALMKSDPEKGLAAITPTYKTMDPQTLRDGYYQQIPGLTTTNARMSESAYKTTQDFALAGGIIKPSQQLTHFEGAAYTNAYTQ